MRFTDSAKLGKVRKLADGYLATEAFAVRTGIQLYHGSEVGVTDKEVVRIYRPEEEVRSPESLTTFSHAPLTLGHPEEQVTADNWKDLAVGEVSTEAEWQDGKIKLPLILKDARAIHAVESGTRELSAGYICDLDMTPGTAPTGEAYDGVQRNIRINHLAIVPRGRAGTECRIGDDADVWGVAPVLAAGGHMTMKTLVLGDKAVQVASDDAGTVEAFRDQSRTALADKDRELATKDAEIKKLKDENEALKAKVDDTATLDERVEARAALVTKVKSIDAAMETKGLSDADLMRKAAIKHYGEVVKDKSDDYIAAAFDLIQVDDAAKKPVYRGAPDPLVTNRTQLDSAPEDYGHSEYTKRLRDGYLHVKEA